MNNEIHLVINTPVGRLGQHDDSYIRKSAIKYRVPYITTLAAAAAAEGIAAWRQTQAANLPVRSLQQRHADLTRSPAEARPPRRDVTLPVLPPSLAGRGRGRVERTVAPRP
jgi:hypothetical protein